VKLAQGRKKAIDVAWLTPRNDPQRTGALRCWRLIAAFEIEGYNVPPARIRQHSNDFRQLYEHEGSFPSYVFLYDEAFHRTDAQWRATNPEPHIAKRRGVAEEDKNVVQVHDGRALDWLNGNKFRDNIRRRMGNARRKRPLVIAA
jgi:hypothetical protein